MQYAVGMQYTVGVSAKRSTHTVNLVNKGGGDHYLQCKKIKPTQWGMQYTVGTEYTVGLGPKMSINIVDLANMGGGDHYLQCKKINSHSGLSKYG